MNAMGLFGEYQQRCSSMLIRFPLSSQSGNLTRDRPTAANIALGRDSKGKS